MRASCCCCISSVTRFYLLSGDSYSGGCDQQLIQDSSSETVKLGGEEKDPSCVLDVFFLFFGRWSVSVVDLQECEHQD